MIDEDTQKLIDLLDLDLEKLAKEDRHFYCNGCGTLFLRDKNSNWMFIVKIYEIVRKIKCNCDYPHIYHLIDGWKPSKVNKIIHV